MQNKLEKTERILIKTNDNHGIHLPDKIYRIEATKEKEDGVIQYEDFKLIGVYEFDKIVNEDKIIVNLNFDTIKKAILRLKFNYDVDIYDIRIIDIPLIDYMKTHSLPIDIKNIKEDIPFLVLEYKYDDFYLKKSFTTFDINDLLQFINKKQNKESDNLFNENDMIINITRDENNIYIKTKYYVNEKIKNDEIIAYVMSEFEEKDMPDYFTIKKYGILGLTIDFYYGK